MPTPKVKAASARIAPAGPTQRATRESVVERILGAIDSELDAVHRVLAKVDPADNGEAERSVRTLVGIARALQDLMAAARADKGTAADEGDPDDVPRGLDELRDALSQRIEAFVAARRGRMEPAPEGAEESGGQAPLA